MYAPGLNVRPRIIQPRTDQSSADPTSDLIKAKESLDSSFKNDGHGAMHLKKYTQQELDHKREVDKRWNEESSEAANRIKATTDTFRSNLLENSEKYVPVFTRSMDEAECKAFRAILAKSRQVPIDDIRYVILPEGHVEFYAKMVNDSWRKIWDNRKITPAEAEEQKKKSAIQ